MDLQFSMPIIMHNLYICVWICPWKYCDVEFLYLQNACPVPLISNISHNSPPPPHLSLNESLFIYHSLSLSLCLTLEMVRIVVPVSLEQWLIFNVSMCGHLVASNSILESINYRHIKYCRMIVTLITFYT